MWNRPEVQSRHSNRKLFIPIITAAATCRNSNRWSPTPPASRCEFAIGIPSEIRLAVSLLASCPRSPSPFPSPPVGEKEDTRAVPMADRSTQSRLLGHLPLEGWAGTRFAPFPGMIQIQNFDNRNDVLLSAGAIMASATYPIDILPASAGLLAQRPTWN